MFPPVKLSSDGIDGIADASTR